MLYLEKKEILDDRLIDYIYLARVAKFSKIGLFKLFQNPSMTISQMGMLNKEVLAKLLLGDQQRTLDSYQKIEKIQKFDNSDENYNRIKKMVRECVWKKIQIITPIEKQIPRIFLSIKPVNRDLIFIQGKVTEQDFHSYSICGSRTPTQDAIIKTNRIAEFMAKKELTLINGFAKGIDIEAFLGAKKGKGRYIGILGSGLENIYPTEHAKYVQDVISNGALVSQRFLWDRVNETSLQIRNRFSAQLSLGSIFIEGNYKSGTIWQHKFALEAKKLIFYLEPQNWNHENCHILKIVKDAGGMMINNDLSNLEQIFEMLNQKSKEQQSVQNE